VTWCDFSSYLEASRGFCPVGRSFWILVQVSGQAKSCPPIVATSLLSRYPRYGLDQPRRPNWCHIRTPLDAYPTLKDHRDSLETQAGLRPAWRGMTLDALRPDVRLESLNPRHPRHVRVWMIHALEKTLRSNYLVERP
jgi:hypothetical protein